MALCSGLRLTDLGELDDPALMNVFGQDGAGICRAVRKEKTRRLLRGVDCAYLSGKVAQMPCCAFAACIVAQLLFGVRAIKRAWFGPGAGEIAERNLAVEWRLDSAPAVSLDLAPESRGWLGGRRSLRGLALATALEVVIVLGAIYGVVEHLGHGAGHSGHVHQVAGLGRDLVADRANTDGAPVPSAESPQGTFFTR